MERGRLEKRQQRLRSVSMDGEHGMGLAEDSLRIPGQGRLKLLGFAVLCVAVATIVFGVHQRSRQYEQLTKWTAAQAVPSVAIIRPTPLSGGHALQLPGTLEAYYNAPIYARVPGYLKKWYVDIGTPVASGQVLATIDTPDLDQELLQAQARLNSALAEQALAKITAGRWAALLRQDAVSRQDSDEKAGDLAAKSAMVAAAQADVQRLEALTSFRQVRAPFAGVVTARKTDIGDLINAGAGVGSSSELFDVADLHELRLYVSVPQGDSANLGRGLTAHITVPQYAGRTWTAKLVGTSDSVSAATGTVLLELMVDNSDLALHPGDYAQVSLTVPAAPGSEDFRVPATALLFGHHGMEVGTLGLDNRVVMRHIQISHDLGDAVDVSAGLSGRDSIIDSPPDSLKAGEVVQPMSNAVPMVAAAAQDRA
jgi:membrane fusion protein, multidrug efflux system